MSIVRGDGWLYRERTRQRFMAAAVFGTPVLGWTRLSHFLRRRVCLNHQFFDMNPEASR